MKRNKFLSLLVALIMAVQLLPLSAFAEEEVTEYAESVETLYSSSSSDDDNDELLEGYIEQIFGISEDSGILLTATYTGEDALSGLNLEVYRQLKSAIEDIAANGGSTVVSITLDWTYTAATLNEATEAFLKEFDSSLIVRYLLNDCPYEMYWYDKTAGVTTSRSMPYYNYGTYVVVARVDLTFSFSVASAYQDGSTYTVNASKAQTAVSAAAYAQTIVDKYASCTDLEKITAYKEEICSLVTYEKNYTSADYGDIWQLVYVFDQNSSTNVVCEGYSKAFQYLCDLSGIDSIIVTGYMAGGTGGGDHMWNVVYLDGINYLVDVTNSDSGTVGQNGGLFMVCEDEATTIYDGTDSTGYYGYVFHVNNQYIYYVYDSTTLSLYNYEEYLELGSRFLGKSLTLDGEIGVTYYFNLNNVDNPESYYLTGTIDGDSYTVYADDETKEVDGITYYRYIVYVSPTQLQSTITASLKNSSGTLVSLEDYSVYQYCEAAITSDSTSDLYAVKDLCAAVLNYGYYVETWLEKTSTIDVSSIYSGWDDPVTGTWDVDLSSYGNTATTGVTKKLALDGTGIYIRVYGIDTSKVYTVSGKEVKTGNDGSDYIEFKVPAKEMSSTFTILEDGVTFTTYSVYSYIKNTIESSSSGEALVNVCKAIYYYGQESAAYQGWR